MIESRIDMDEMCSPSEIEEECIAGVGEKC
jgi:hypothetical protein